MTQPKLLTPDQAIALQEEWIQLGRLPIWSVTWNPKDFPGKAVARAQYGDGGGVSVSDGYLIADTVEALRELLPPFLTRLNRFPDDEPQIVETWL